MYGSAAILGFGVSFMPALTAQGTSIMVERIAPNLASVIVIKLEGWTLEKSYSEFAYARITGWEQGAAVLDDIAIGNARTVLDQYGHLPIPSEITPLPDGQLLIVWEKEGAYISLSFGPRHIVHLYSELPGAEPWEMVASLNNRELRTKLADALGAINNARRSRPFYVGTNLQSASTYQSL